jgi:hypothetical protein
MQLDTGLGMCVEKYMGPRSPSRYVLFLFLIVISFMLILHQAVTALAGFPVGEIYRVPWSEVPVPEVLKKKIFPFVEEALATLRAKGCKNQGTINFLELLQQLRPYFWRVCYLLFYCVEFLTL